MLITFIISQVCLVGGFLALLYKLEKSHKSERQELYQRIQAPQLAVTEHYTPSTANPMSNFVDPDNDEAWIEYLKELGGSS